MEKVITVLVVVMHLALPLSLVGAIGYVFYESETTQRVHDFTCTDANSDEFIYYKGNKGIDLTPSADEYNWYPVPLEKTLHHTRCVKTKSYRVPK